ncbi:MAG: chitobiase/beta-hexosaminidase C-terminal domain-containing protein [Prevotella sp.]|nr:chitobiase/beta-hexosaminidase C-terminal domain-containing protein [Prevotella sp.]
MKKTLLMLAMLLGVGTAAMAQRFTDKLDRGLVAVPDANGNRTLVSWRRLANEYYDVTYNLYRNGVKVKENLTVTNYVYSNGGYANYQVAAVVDGVEQEKCNAVTPWKEYVYKLGSNRYPTAYLDIALATVYDRDGNDVTSNYSPNDAEMADLDGDGQLEIIVKRLNTADASTAIDASRIYSPNSTQFVVLDAYDVDWQTGDATLMWRIDCGPNMVSLNSTEIDIIAYDWDEDGKAEVVLRGADNMIVYDSDGQTQLYTIGDMSVNTRTEFNTTDSQYAWTHTGAEYLIYMDGKTGSLYQQMDYPLKRLESGESNLKSAWGDDYGHRSSKYFFGAPFLDGRKASLFLGRGIYTRHKFIAMDLDRGSHTWSERWRWNCNDKNSPWYGNGYHNFIIADVDEDGRDEIVYGSMVIDDNGKGLSTTGYGHGDAQHVSDFDPYRKGLEFFGCLEEARGGYGCNYRNATTSEIYFKHNASGDDGRALMGNFSNEYPGSIGRSSSASGMVNALRNNSVIDAYAGDSYITWSDLNFRIYWDGDLCSEILNSPGTAKEAKVEKPGTGRLFTSSGCNMNNDSKNNPCFQGDIIGDWREEIVVRCGTNLRVYTTGYSTNYSVPCLWFDHQYRQAMVWQMMAYNQPPHLSYFLGEMEGITVAPPPLTMEGRMEIESGSSITSSQNGKHVLVCDATTVGIADGISPQVITVVVNSSVEGTDNNSSIKTSFLSTQLGDNNGKGDITGSARLVKQGDGLLKLTAREFSYSGNTDIWGGTLRFRGTFKNSDVWMNRHTSFFSGATMSKSLTMEYGSTLYPTNGDVSDASVVSYGTTTIGTLNLHEGARIVMQMDPDNSQYDQVNIGTLNIRTRSGDAWENYGPEYLKPVIEIQAASALKDGEYILGTLGGLGEGTLVSDIILEGAGDESSLIYSGGKLRLKVGTEKVAAPTVTGDGKIKYVKAGESSLGNDVSVYYTVSASESPSTEGTLLEKEFLKMPNETTYYFYSVSSSGIKSSATVVSFDGIITETYDFEAIAIEAGTSINATFSGEAIIQEGGQNVKLVNYSSYKLGNRFASSYLRTSGGQPTGQDWWIRNGTGWNCLLTYTGNTNTYYLSVLDLKDGDKITFTLSKGSLTLLSSNVDGVTTNTELVSGTEYTISTTAETTHLDLSGIGQSSCIKKVVIKTPAVEESLGSPEINVSAANGGTRTISIAPGVGSQGSLATETFYTLDGSDPSLESNSARALYTNAFDITANTTVKAVSYLINTKSTIATKSVSAGSTLTLAAPTITKTGYADGAFTVRLSSDQSSLVAAPSTINYFYSIDGGEIMRSGEGGTAIVYGGSSFATYTTAEGYNDSPEVNYILPVMPAFKENWTIDFTSISETSYSTEKLGDYTKLVDNATHEAVNDNFGVEGNGTDNNQAFIHNGGLYMAFSGGRNIAVKATEGQYVRVKMTTNPSSASGLALQEDLCYGDYYVLRATSTGVLTINIPRYTVISSVELLDVVNSVTKTISEGWATYCSPYALDFSNPIGNLTKAYYVTGIKLNGKTLTLLEINGIVPPGTGVLLEGNGSCEIPVLSGSSASTEGNLLVGVLEDTQLEENSIYVLIKENGITGFYKNNNAFTVGARTAYLPADVVGGLSAIPSNARNYQLLEGEVTGISEILRPISESNRYYNLQGQRVIPQRQGIYIVNGRKVVVKSNK